MAKTWRGDAAVGQCHCRTSAIAAPPTTNTSATTPRWTRRSPRAVNARSSCTRSRRTPSDSVTPLPGPQRTGRRRACGRRPASARRRGAGDCRTPSPCSPAERDEWRIPVVLAMLRSAALPRFPRSYGGFTAHCLVLARNREAVVEDRHVGTDHESGDVERAVCGVVCADDP